MTSKTEHSEQVTFVNWFRATFPDVLIFAIPNGGHRAMAEGKRLRAEGVVAGVPDLCVPAWGLWIEMKRTIGGRVSPEQDEMAAYLSGCGYTVVFCRGWREAVSAVESYRSSGGCK